MIDEETSSGTSSGTTSGDRVTEAWVRIGVGTGAMLSAATAVVALLETGFGIDNGSSVYLVAVAIVAIRWGTRPAAAASLGSFLIYNLLFVEPRHTLAVAAPEELLNLLLLLFVGVVIGRLAGTQRDRERVAQRREREARAQSAITREFATAPRLPQAMEAVLHRLALETRFRRMWVGFGPTTLLERIGADTAAGEPVAAPGKHAVLRRGHDEGIVAWTRINPPGSAPEAPGAFYRVELRADDAVLGSLWGQRDRGSGDPDLEETRLIAAAADQLTQAVRRDRLAARAADLEIERRSDELRTALLDSVSHDLRTPLASIRAAAGGLADPAMEPSPDEVRSTGRTIDQEAERLNRLVGTLLDMSRIQAGALVTDITVVPLSELIEPALARLRIELSSHPVTIDLPPDIPSVRADPTLLTQAVTNLLENAVRHTPAGAPITIRARSRHEQGDVALIVEDGGPGVPSEDLPHLFKRFYRARSLGAGGSRRGAGLGLSVVEGLVAAMGGRVRAERSDLGGLAVTLELPAEGARS